MAVRECRENSDPYGCFLNWSRTGRVEMASAG